MTNISSAAAAARESARDDAGRFGEQERSAEEVMLVPTNGTQPRSSWQESHVDLHDIRVMGGDEIDALDDREVRYAYAAAVIAADRLRTRLDARGLTVVDDTQAAHLRVVDTRDPSLDDFHAVESAARHRLGVEGTIRTGADFKYALEADHGIHLDDDARAALWSLHQEHGMATYEHDETRIEAEQRAWRNAVEDTLEEAGRGQSPSPYASAVTLSEPSAVSTDTMILDADRQAGDASYFVNEARLTDGTYLTSVRYAYPVQAGDWDADEAEYVNSGYQVKEEVERFASRLPGGWARLGADDRSSYAEFEGVPASDTTVYATRQEAEAAARRLAEQAASGASAAAASYDTTNQGA